MLAIFPAGEVSHWQMQEAQITDPEWNDTAARLAIRTGASALPVYFCGPMHHAEDVKPEAIDGLVFVDLRRTEETVLDKYMGAQPATKFRCFHRLACLRGEDSSLTSPLAAE